MTFNEYQFKAGTTAIYPEKGSRGGLIYTILGLANEAGEVAGKMKKILRDSDGVITEKHKDSIAGELGDVLWYLAMVSKEIGLSFDGIADENILKLADRCARDKIGGSGDNR